MAEPEVAPKKIGKFTLNHEAKFEIDTAGNKTLDDISKATWAKVAAGINNFTPNTNETTVNDEYYDGEGFGTSDITSKRLALTLAGHRLEGDPAQDYIAKHLLDIGDQVKTLFRWTQVDGTVVQGVVTMGNLVTSGGAPGAKQTFSCVLTFNGKPSVTTADAVKPGGVGA